MLHFDEFQLRTIVHFMSFVPLSLSLCLHLHMYLCVRAIVSLYHWCTMQRFMLPLPQNTYDRSRFVFIQQS
jgi:hypothetical protein